MSELKCVMLVSTIIMAIEIAIFIAIAIIAIDDYIAIDEYPYKHKLNKGYMITGIIGFIIFIISLSMFIRSCKIYYSPELSYERLLNNLDKTETELQKFYIDHPEFKENEK